MLNCIINIFLLLVLSLCVKNKMWKRQFGVLFDFLSFRYHIYSAISRGCPVSRMITNNLAIIQVLPFPDSPMDLDLSYKMDLDLLGLFWKEKLHLIKIEKNTVMQNGI